MSRVNLKWMGAVCALAVAVAGLAGAGSWAGAGGAVAAPNRVVVPTPRGGPPPGPPPTPRPRRDTGPAGPGAPGGGPIPTATPGAGVVQPTPPQRTPQAPPPEPTRERLAPSGTLSTYTDPNLGFSFRYPANWYLQAPGRQAVAPPDAYGLTLTNYDPAVAVKRPPTAEEVQAGITIHLGMRTDITKYRSLDDWIADRPRLSPQLEVADVQPITVSGVPARRWLIRGPRVATGEAVQVGVVRGDRLYTLGASPATSRQIGVFDTLVESFRLPGAP